jgi:hypothetical protein
MPRIIVQADPTSEREPVTLLQERVSPSDMESQHFASQLLERVNWAIGDAKQVELEARQAERDSRQDRRLAQRDGRHAERDRGHAESTRGPALTPA